MKLSADGRKVLIEREGRRLVAYKDSVGIWTIGIGHTSAAGPPKVVPKMKITAEECDEIFLRDIVKYENVVESVIRVPMTRHEFDSWVSWCYNIGVNGFTRSSAVKRLNLGDFNGAANAMLMWNKPKEIISRRQGEYVQFKFGEYIARVPTLTAADKARIEHA